MRGAEVVCGVSHEEILERDRTAWRRAKKAIEAHPRSEMALLGWLSEQVPESARVFLGNSLPIREWNLAATRDHGFAGGVYANRGANGIDGELSSFLGTSVGAEEAWGIFGDLTTLYDLAAPWVLSQLGEGRRRFVVINNGGGRIFSQLPAVRALDEKGRGMFENAHGVSFEQWAAMWGLGYVLISEPGDLPVGGGDVVIEIRAHAAESGAFLAEMNREREG